MKLAEQTHILHYNISCFTILNMKRKVSPQLNPSLHHLEVHKIGGGVLLSGRVRAHRGILNTSLPHPNDLLTDIELPKGSGHFRLLSSPCYM